MSLGKYHAKRQFNKTPEPKGKVKRSTNKLEFVVQEHHASQLHYDFRLELDGVLKSWALPKGPSMNPHDRHLAVMVEDHPFEYRTFEGEIPEGNYGAGNVIIWDKGVYEPREDTDDPEKALRAGLKKGHLTFILHGQKLQGEFALIKMLGKDEDAWLLVKKGDEFASAKDVTKQDRSVVSGKKVDEDTVDLVKYPKSQMPEHVKPMLCTLVDQPFNCEGWLFEIKWDGYRAIGAKNKDEILLYSRNQLDFSKRYTPVAEALRKLPNDVVLDGEITVVDSDGTPHFEWLQNWGQNPQGSLQYQVFDVLWCNGRDVQKMPLVQRKQLLKSLIPDNSIIKYSDHIEADGIALFKEIKNRGLEGIVAKRSDGEYKQGLRGEAWLKIKTHLRQEVVIGGFTEPRGGRQHLGSLLVGVYEKGGLVYTGHSGGGIPDEQRRLLRAKLDKLERKSSPFSTTPKPNAPVHWVQPKQVAEMNFSEWTKEGYMRQPKFVGLRPDKEPKNVHREKPKKPALPEPKTTSKKQHKFEFTHLDKVYWQELGLTKGDLIAYYQSVGEIMLPYLKDRPHSLNRHPHGYKGESFYQKDITFDVPSFVTLAPIYSESNKAEIHYMVCNNIETLLYMAQLGCIEINPWNSQVKNLDNPDWAVIDLDPEGTIKFADVIKVAKTVHEVCDEWEIPSYPKTSGKTGIHIFIPLHAKYNYEQAKNFAHLIAIEVNKRQPKITSLERMPDKRKNKIYLDYLQNRVGQTLAAPYSVRPTKQASVATPLHWDEVKVGLDPTAFTIKTTPKRLKSIGDLWKPVVGKGIDLAKVLKQL